MTAAHTSITMATTGIALFLSLLFLLSSPVPTSAGTIFEARFPTACVNPLLSLAGFCALNNGCTKTCFKSSNTFGSGTSSGGSTTTTNSGATSASTLSLYTQALDNFYVPVDAVECDQFEDPICPATTCCPACKDELIELYQCLILESNYHFLDPLARDCPIDCKPKPPANRPTGTGVSLRPSVERPPHDRVETAAPVEATTVAPVPVTTMAPVLVPTMAPVPATTMTPVPPLTMAPVPVPTMAPVPVPTMAPVPVIVTTMAPVPVPTMAPVPVPTIAPVPVIVTTVAPVPVSTSPQKPEPMRPKTYLVPNWIIPQANETRYQPMTIRVQDSLIFVWSSGTHNVYIYPNANSTNPCDSTNKILIGDTTSNPTMFTFREFYAGKTVRFACDIGGHCNAGMHMDVTILPLPVVEQAQQTAPPAPAPTSPPVPVTMTIITPAPVPVMVATIAPVPVTTTTRAPKAHTAPNWVIPPINVIGIPYPPLMVRVGDSLTFAWDTGTHDVYIYPNAKAPNHCDSTDKILVGDTKSNPTTYLFTEADAGKTLHFVCSIGAHCDAGMRMNVAVLAATPPTAGTVPSTTGAASLVEAIATGGIP